MINFNQRISMEVGVLVNYIVLDLEWNQGSEEEESDPFMPVEIIEIGAVKLNHEFQVIDEFSCIIKPVKYKTLHFRVKDMLKIDETYLYKGRSFQKGAGDFLKWCGSNYRFCTWGSTDLMELQRNLDFFHMKKLEKPLKYYDLQKIYSRHILKEDSLRALDKAVDELNIEKAEPFHHAITDAHYTAQVLSSIDKHIFLKKSSIDIYNNPQNIHEEIQRVQGNQYEYITREFKDKLEALSDREVKSYHCILCSQSVKKLRGWFASSPTVYYCILECRTHGYIYGKIKIKTAVNGNIFIVKRFMLTDRNRVNSIENRYQQLKMKKLEKQRQIRRH